MELKPIFQYLPKEILHIILKYDGKIHFRNGEYINKVLITKEMKWKIENIPYKIFMDNFTEVFLNMRNYDSNQIITWTVFWKKNPVHYIFWNNYRMNMSTIQYEREQEYFLH